MALDTLKSVFTYRFGYEDELDRPSAAVEWARGLAGYAGAHLTGLFATQRHTVSNVMGASVVSNVVGRENSSLEAAATSRAEALRAEAAQAGVDCDVETLSAAYPDVRETLAARARLYDLVVADAAPEAAGMQRELLIDVLFQASRPVVIVPADAGAVSLDLVVVAWDGTGPATRALFDALPLLRGAKRVEVVNVVGDKELPATGAATAIVPHLQRHGIAAEAREIDHGNQGAGLALHEHSVASNAGLLVMGAYAHSRLRQMVFGGVTSALLKNARVPLLMSH